MNFWHMQMHQNNEKWDWAREKEVLEKTGYIGMGVWVEDDPSNPQQTDFETKMQIGDIVAVRRGKELIALTQVIGNYEYTEKVTDLDWFKRRRKIKILDWYKNEYNYKVAWLGTLKRCSSPTADTTINIKKWYEKVMSDSDINEVIDLLKYKHQVILQGPPGTGKTRLAKLVAKQLTQIERKGTPQDIIDSLVKSFDTQSNEAKLSRTKNDKLLSRFYESFPQDKLSSLSLPEYAIGHGDQDSLCWWLEVGLESLGKFSPGFSNNYPIYWSKSNNKYMLNNKVAGAADAESAMELVSNELSKLIQRTDLDNSIKFFGPCFTLKLLHSYFPDEYFPINSVDALNNALKLLGSYNKQMGTIEKNIKLKDIYLDKRQFNTNLTLIEFASIIWDNFNLKDGEELSENDEVMTHGEFEIIQFHSAYTYEDFVRGIVASSHEGVISYKVENKILAEFAKKALENPNGKYLLIIDEINRANLPSVLGELIYALEYRGEFVQSMYEYEGTRDIKLPKNLYIIGTMNTADRSVGHIDYAIRRRFAFYDVLPNASVVIHKRAKELFDDVARLFDNDNSYLSSDFDANDVQIGHSYFILSDDEDMTEKELEIELKQKIEYEIKPILYEYIKDGVLLDSAREVVENLHV
ncbi:ATPase family protein associated with various cellular activities (AAA) [Psychrobacter immobilis]|uniref:ATPase family protein associated with various cellular activities (AAA) n=1 Tax=Psychrobacter immobilis TaxID=498 RepID=A0A2V2A2G4_PSYIM|nr:AAA family ATPase [Psychrobacter immobilis]PWK10112.1 ATPase family protein associated with various cellular activities (AAA) [Psychrobacter immobilis]